MKKYLILIILLLVCCEDQGSPSYGCTDTAACNYNSNADLEDGSCEYPSDQIIEGNYCSCGDGLESLIYDCDGQCGGDGLVNCDNSCVSILDQYGNQINYQIIYNKLQSLGCTVCHSGPSGNASINMESYQDFINSNIIITNCDSFQNSRILLAIQEGGSMSGYADEELIYILTTWISVGAPE